MIVYCNFKPQSSTLPATWKCSQCGFTTHKKLQRPPSRRCESRDGKQDTQRRVLDYLACRHRAQVLATINAYTAGCGCSSTSAEVYHCRHFDEPVLKQAALRCLEQIKAKVPNYTGRTCRKCEVPGTPTITTENHRLPGRSQVRRNSQRGIVTGASAIHWPCLGSLAIESADQGLGFAVADHGLEPWQRDDLERYGVTWIEHEKPNLSGVKQSLHIPSDLKAWWKPWICLKSPFRLTLWVDSDAVAVGNVSELIGDADAQAQISTERLWTDESQQLGYKLYREISTAIFGEAATKATLPIYQDINSGVLAWRSGDPLIEEWKAWCIRLMSDPDLTKRCRVRDQAGLLVTLMDRRLSGKGHVNLLGDEWNVPADYCRGRQSGKRRPISLNPCELLATAKERHPNARVVHWLGGWKPWKLGVAK